MRPRRRTKLGLLCGLLVVLVGSTSGAALSQSTASVPIRFVVISTAGQNEIPQTMIDTGIAKKYGFDVKIVPFAQVGQQYLFLRGGTGDIAGGNWIDLLRQRKAGLKIKGFMGFQSHSSQMTVNTDSSIRSFNDLRGKRIGEYGTSLLDWYIWRTAGQKAFGLDLERDAQPVTTSVVLFNQLLERGQIDAATQFPNLALAPIAAGKQRVLINQPYLLKLAGFQPRNLLHLQWMLTESWMKKYPGSVSKLRLAIKETYAKLKTDDNLWPPLAKLIFINDPALVRAYMKLQRTYNNPPLIPAQVKETQRLLNALVAHVGLANVGIARVDPNAFIFDPVKK